MMDLSNPKKVPFKDMSDDEKGALLLAHHNGAEIEWLLLPEWLYAGDPCWNPDYAYRVKPKPVTTTTWVNIYGLLISNSIYRSRQSADAKSLYGRTHILKITLTEGERPTVEVIDV